MILDVPYQSQEPLETTSERKWCGLASLAMVLSFYLKEDAPSAQELLDKHGVSFEAGGFLHKDLLKIAREYGLGGFRKSWWPDDGVKSLLEKFRAEGESEADIIEWLKTNTEEGIFTLKQQIKKGIPVIVSVSPEFSPSNSTHLVVVIGYEDANFIVHDPFKRGASFKISEDQFKNFWIRQAIIILK